MSYRIGEPKPKKPNRTVQKLTTPSEIFVTNGSIADIAFPCWYQEIEHALRARRHCSHWHDHVGQPSPNHPDHVCQPHDYAHEHFHHHHKDHHFHDLHRYIDMATLTPIHLLKEGYSKVIISTSEKYEGLSLEGIIDEEEDWVVRLNINADLEEAAEDPVKVKVVIKVADEDESIIDVAAICTLVIMPAPID